MICIATFYSHFGAIRFKKLCSESGYKAKVMPVPRTLSSSCGTCVKYEGDLFCPTDPVPEEIEQIVEIHGNEYISHYRAENS